MVSNVEISVRAMDPARAETEATLLWRKVGEMKRASEAVGEWIFKRVLLCSARCVLARLENSGAAEEHWLGYLDLFLCGILSFGTCNADAYLGRCKDVFLKILGYPDKPRDLFHEFLFCLSSQKHQRARMGSEVLRRTPPPPMLDNTQKDVAQIPDLPLSEVRNYTDILPRRLTFPLQNGVVRMRLGNPMPIPDVRFLRGGYKCDTCHINNIQVAYQAMIYNDSETDGVRSAAQFRNLPNSNGFDMCVGCAVYFYRAATLRLSRCFGDFSRTFRVSSVADVRLHFLLSEENVVKMTVSILPWATSPVVWIAKKDEHDPPPSWRSALRIECCNRYNPSQRESGSDDDQCAICLQPLANGAPVVETSCKHCFHVDCVQEMRSMMEDKCPFCRRENVFTSSIDLTNWSNKYEVQLDRPDECVEFVLIVGALLTSDGEYNNPTNIAACRSLHVTHPCKIDFDDP